MSYLKEEYYVKWEIIDSPELYPSAHTKRVNNISDSTTYAAICTNYVQEVVKIVGHCRKDFDLSFYKLSKNPSQSFISLN